MPAPVPRMHGNAHDHGGPDPVRIAWEATSEGGGGGGGGIDFDVSPQEGGFLEVTATTGTISLETTGVDQQIGLNASGQIALHAVSNLLVTSQSGALNIDIQSGGILGALANNAVWDIDGDWATRFQNNAESFSIWKPGPVRTFSFRADGSIWNVVGLPTVNPGGTGNIWNNGGVLNIT